MINDGGPAFPIEDCFQTFQPKNTEEYKRLLSGMTLRDYFAAKAMQGFAVDSEASWSSGVIGMAEAAYKWADAMIEARKQGE